MLAYNPFSDLGATIPSIAMQAFLIAMVMLVIAGVVHISKTSSTFIRDVWNYNFLGNISNVNFQLFNTLFCSASYGTYVMAHWCNYDMRGRFLVLVLNKSKRVCRGTPLVSCYVRRFICTSIISISIYRTIVVNNTKLRIYS